jgi:hypothetical protein
MISLAHDRGICKLANPGAAPSPPPPPCGDRFDQGVVQVMRDEIARLQGLLDIFASGDQRFQSMRHVSHPDFPSWRRMYKNIFMSSGRNLWSFGLNTGQHLFQILYPNRCCVSICYYQRLERKVSFQIVPLRRQYDHRNQHQIGHKDNQLHHP